MSEPFLGEIEIFAFDYAPSGWMHCNGQLLPIQQYPALFSLLSTTYGGDGRITFALPNLQGRIPIGQGNGAGLSPYVIGETTGEATHTLQFSETPTHQHTLVTNATPGSPVGDTPEPTVVLTQTSGLDHGNKPLTVNIYATDNAPNQALAASAIGFTGGQPHNNMMPYLTLNVCIALQGIFPSRS